MILEEVKTCDLVLELQLREGVECIAVDPHEDGTVTVNGPAIILVVTD